MECRYDGTFVGLLSLFARLFELGLEPSTILAGEPPQGDLFASPVEVAADAPTARRLLAELSRRHGPRVSADLRDAWLSQVPEAPLLLFRYLQRGRELGTALGRHLADPDVHAVQRLARRVRRESHRLKGLVRFRELADGLLYAPLRPDALVLPLLGSHFHRRLRPAPWLIHDLNRNLALLDDGRGWLLGELAPHAPPPLAAAETDWQQLWRRFCTEIAIDERRSLRRQQHFLPKKYWGELVEFDQAPKGGRPAKNPAKT